MGENENTKRTSRSPRSVRSRTRSRRTIRLLFSSRSRSRRLGLRSPWFRLCSRKCRRSLLLTSPAFVPLLLVLFLYTCISSSSLSSSFSVSLLQNSAAWNVCRGDSSNFFFYTHKTLNFFTQKKNQTTSRQKQQRRHFVITDFCPFFYITHII